MMSMHRVHEEKKKLEEEKEKNCDACASCESRRCETLTVRENAHT